MPALVEREGMDPLRQCGEQLAEVAPRVQPGVEQQDWNAVRVALLDVGQLESISEHGQMHHALILSGCAASSSSEAQPSAVRAALTAGSLREA